MTGRILVQPRHLTAALPERERVAVEAFQLLAVDVDVAVLLQPVRDPQRADILVFETPPLAKERCGAGGLFIKRVVALPGVTWQAGMYFMMGDNRSQSCDSREWGSVPTANLVGKVVRILRTQ